MKSLCVLLYFLAQVIFTLAELSAVSNNTDITFYAQLLCRGYFECSAVVLSSRFLLTTARCTKEAQLDEYKIRVSPKIEEVEGETVYEIKQFIPHPQYNKIHYSNNIALIELKLNLDLPVKPVPLARRLPRDEVETRVQIFGFFDKPKDNPYYPALTSDDAIVETYANSYEKLIRDNNIIRYEEYYVRTNYPCTEEGAPIFIDGGLFAIATYYIGVNGCQSQLVLKPYINIFHYRAWIVKTAKLDSSYFPFVNREIVKEAPFYAQLLVDNKLFCSATAISSDLLLTTAECARKRKEDYRILVGSIRRGQGEKNYSVHDIITHESFNEKTLENNIALIKLSSPVGDKVWLDLFSTKISEYKSLEVKIFGFASEDDMTHDTETLLSDDNAYTANQESCRRYSQLDGRYFDENVFCVNTRDRYPCMEHGSPLLYDDQLIAIFSTSGNLNNCQPSLKERPLSYIQVHAYRPWIIARGNLPRTYFGHEIEVIYNGQRFSVPNKW